LPRRRERRKTKNAALWPRFLLALISRLELQPGIVLARQRERAGQRRLVAAEGGIVEYAVRPVAGQLGIIIARVLARECFGAGIEIRPLLNDDASRVRPSSPRLTNTVCPAPVTTCLFLGAASLGAASKAMTAVTANVMATSFKRMGSSRLSRYIANAYYRASVRRNRAIHTQL